MTTPIRKPYLLFLGDAPDLLAAKTATGIAHWRPDHVAGEFRYADARATTGMPSMSLAEGRAAGAATLVVGIANAGGKLAARWIETLREALELGYDLASGMHRRLTEIAELRDAARHHGRQLHDVRYPEIELAVGTGKARSGRRLLTVGTDCSSGKMYSALAIERELRARGLAATFRATGQTGILITGTGISVDAVVADFISGAIEQLTPAADESHWDVIEGQGSLFHPAFAGVSLGLLHGAQADALVMCHEPERSSMRGLSNWPLPSLEDCVAHNEYCARLTNPQARVCGVALNTHAFDAATAEQHIATTADRLGLPCVDPLRTGVGALVDALI